MSILKSVKAGIYSEIEEFCQKILKLNDKDKQNGVYEISEFGKMYIIKIQRTIKNFCFSCKDIPANTRIEFNCGCRLFLKNFHGDEDFSKIYASVPKSFNEIFFDKCTINNKFKKYIIENPSHIQSSIIKIKSTEFYKFRDNINIYKYHDNKIISE